MPADRNLWCQRLLHISKPRSHWCPLQNVVRATRGRRMSQAIKDCRAYAAEREPPICIDLLVPDQGGGKVMTPSLRLPDELVRAHNAVTVASHCPAVVIATPTAPPTGDKTSTLCFAWLQCDQLRS